MSNFTDHLIGKLNEIFNNQIPQFILDHICFLNRLEKEFALNAVRPEYGTERVFSQKFIKNKDWRGLWLKATGNDSILYMSYLINGLTRPEYSEKGIEYWYRKANPKETHTPYCIKLAEEDVKKI